jgi:hypothetical protein
MGGVVAGTNGTAIWNSTDRMKADKMEANGDRFGRQDFPPRSKAVAKVGDLIVVDQVIDRAMTDFPDHLLPWATSFVKVKFDRAGNGELGRPVLHNWRQLEFKPDTFQRHIGERTLYVTEYEHGWILELGHELENGREAFILTYVLGELPMLCPTLADAARLAEDSYLAPSGVAYWRSYW